MGLLVMRYCARRVVAREKHDLAREGAMDEIELGVRAVEAVRRARAGAGRSAQEQPRKGAPRDAILRAPSGGAGKARSCAGGSH
jgi:hypothetical protein